MLVLVRYFVRLGLFVALILLNASVVSLSFGYARNIEHLVSLAGDMLYSAVLLVAISALISVL